MPAPPNTPGNPWLIKGILAFVAGVGLTLGASAVLTWTDVAIGRSSAGVLKITNGGTSEAIRLSAGGRIYGNAVTVSVSATKTHHTSDGTLVSIRAVAHSLALGQVLLFQTWTWADGGGLLDGYHRVTTITDEDNFVIAPASGFSTTGAPLVCPTTGTNPGTVGTIIVQARVGLGDALTGPMDESIALGGKTVVEKNDIRTTTTDGLVLKNSTGATTGAGAVQYSPRLRFRGSAFDTDAAAPGIDLWDWWMESINSSGTSTASGWYLKFSKNGAAGVSALSIDTDGTCTVRSNVIASGLYTTNGRTTDSTMSRYLTGGLLSCWNRYSWTAAMVVSGRTSASTSNVQICTLKAKQYVRRVIIYTDAAATGVDSPTVSVGRVGADYIDFIVASTPGTASIFGNAMAEIGTNLKDSHSSTAPIEDFAALADMTSTTEVFAQFKCDGAPDINQWAGCTGDVYILTETLP
jgi:hypothetical protein